MTGVGLALGLALARSGAKAQEARKIPRLGILTVGLGRCPAGRGGLRDPLPGAAGGVTEKGLVVSAGRVKELGGAPRRPAMDSTRAQVADAGLAAYAAEPVRV